MSSAPDDGVWDLCDPGSKREEIFTIAWGFVLCGLFMAALLRTIFSTKRIQKMKKGMSRMSTDVVARVKSNRHLDIPGGSQDTMAIDLPIDESITKVVRPSEPPSAARSTAKETTETSLEMLRSMLSQWSAKGR